MRVVTDIRHHVRCRKCSTRRVLPKHPDNYRTLPQCRGCGARDYRVDKWMMERNTRSVSCNCDGYHFRHRQGSKYCCYRADGTRRVLGDHDFHDQQLEYLMQRDCLEYV